MRHISFDRSRFRALGVAFFITAVAFGGLALSSVGTNTTEPKCDPIKYDVDVLTGEVVFSRGSKLRPISSIDQEYLIESGFVAPQTYTGEVALVDFREKDTPIKNQGNCGSCWAHAFTEVMEWHLYNQTDRFTVLSQMEVTVCTQYGNKCNGEAFIGDVILDYAASRRPLIPGDVYPYDPRLYGFARDFDPNCLQCDVNTTSVAQGSQYGYFAPSVRVGAWGLATPECTSGLCLQQNMTQLALALQSHGPLMIGVDASQWSSYKGGIFPAEACSSAATSGDHAVVLVGMTEDTWIVRNSWSSSWGEDGYIRLERGDGLNTCGLANQALWIEADPIMKA